MACVVFYFHRVCHKSVYYYQIQAYTASRDTAYGTNTKCGFLGWR